MSDEAAPAMHVLGHDVVTDCLPTLEECARTADILAGDIRSLVGAAVRMGNKPDASRLWDAAALDRLATLARAVAQHEEIVKRAIVRERRKGGPPAAPSTAIAPDHEDAA